MAFGRTPARIAKAREAILTRLEEGPARWYDLMQAGKAVFTAERREDFDHEIHYFVVSVATDLLDKGRMKQVSGDSGVWSLPDAQEPDLSDPTATWSVADRLRHAATLLDTGRRAEAYDVLHRAVTALHIGPPAAPHAQESA